MLAEPIDARPPRSPDRAGRSQRISPAHRLGQDHEGRLWAVKGTGSFGAGPTNALVACITATWANSLPRSWPGARSPVRGTAAE